MMVFVSRYTPNLINGEKVLFEIGEKVRYRMRNGTEYDIVIDSELMENQGYLGYEAIFPDGRFFAVAKGIIDWNGKVPDRRCDITQFKKLPESIKFLESEVEDK